MRSWKAALVTTALATAVSTAAAAEMPRLTVPPVNTVRPGEVRVLNPVQAPAGPGAVISNAAWGTVWAWGQTRTSFGDGLAENTMFDESRVPVKVDTLIGVKKITMRSNEVLVLKADGTVWAWGGNQQGQLGNGTTQLSLIPVRVSGLDSVVDIANTGLGGLAVKLDGTVWAWGNNGCGQLGNGRHSNSEVSTVPVRVRDLLRVKAVASGGCTSYALMEDGSVFMWGARYSRNGGEYATIPERVNGLNGVTSIAAGGGYALFLKNDGTVWAWGHNGYGQLGTGNNTAQYAPVRLSGISGVSAVSTGDDFTLAVKSDGTVWAWGNNGSGQLGDGNTQGWRHEIRQVSGLAGRARLVAAGGAHALVLMEDGKVWQWGGILSNGYVKQATPVRVRDMDNVTGIAAWDFSLAIK